MSEYETVDAITNLHSNFLQGQVVFMSIVTAYIVAAYIAGMKLTTFQVIFASLLLILFGLQALGGQFFNAREMFHYGTQLQELRGIRNPIGTNSDLDGLLFYLLVFWGVRIFLLAGALVFMWQVRHPKTE